MPPTPSRKRDSRFIALFLIDPHLCGVLATREAFVRGCFDNSPLGFLTGSVRVEPRYEKRRDLLAVLVVAFFLTIHLVRPSVKEPVESICEEEATRGMWSLDHFLVIICLFVFYSTASSTKQQQPVWLPFSCVL